MKDSARHHYLPEFFVKGFVNQEGKLWVFDKSTNTIRSKSVAPKQLFYEWDLNTITYEDEDFDFIEKSFSKTDSIFAEYIKTIRDTDDIDTVEDLAHIGHLIVFIAQLFWRTPSNKRSTEEILKFYKTTKTEWESFKVMSGLGTLDDQTREKLLLPLISMDVIRDNETKSTEPIRFKILETKERFLISDNPILFKAVPIHKDDFSGSLAFPISKQRVFIGLENSSYALKREEIQLINLLLITQADKFVACDSREHLERYVRGYQHFINISLEEKQEITNRLFKAINGN